MLAERNTLRKEIRNMTEKIMVNEREVIWLKETNNNVEKKIQQYQAAEVDSRQKKALIDSEMAKVKVRRKIFEF